MPSSRRLFWRFRFQCSEPAIACSFFMAFNRVDSDRSVAMVLVGHPDYEVTGGSVLFKGEKLDMELEERSLAGLFMSFQSPIEIPGVSNADFLNMAYNAKRRKLGLPELSPPEFCAYIYPKLEVVNMKTDFLNRNVNEGFNGGERKRNEIFAVLYADFLTSDQKMPLTFTHILFYASF